MTTNGSFKVVDDAQMPWYHGNITREKTEKYVNHILVQMTTRVQSKQALTHS